MAVHNGERYLPQAVDSVLVQTYRDFEFLIVNDGSTDRSDEILRSYSDPRIRILENPKNIGLTRSLNLGLQEARGSFVARQDADDRSDRCRLEKQVAFLETHNDAALVGSQFRVINEAGRVLRGLANYRAQTPLAIQWQLLFGNPFVHTSVMFRRSLIYDTFRGYDESYVFNQDFELWSRVLASCTAYNLAEPLVDYRAHEHSIAGVRGEHVFESRRRNLERNKAVQRRNVLRVLRDERLASQWPELWSRVGASWVAGPPEDSGHVLDLIEDMRSCFCKLYPTAEHDTEMRRTQAAVLLETARLLIPHDRRVAARAFLAAAMADPHATAKAATRLGVVALRRSRLCSSVSRRGI
jgi:hypothetical protein